MDLTTSERLTETLDSIVDMIGALRERALSDHYVSHESEAQTLERAVEQSLLLGGQAAQSGQGEPWAKLAAALHVLHHEVVSRTREPETLGVGSPLVQLMDKAIKAAEAAKQSPSPGQASGRS